MSDLATLTIPDIAALIATMPVDSDEFDAALGELWERAPRAGGNQPPLEEELGEELAPFRKRQAELVETAKTAVIVDGDSAQKTLDLAALCKAFEDEIEEWRKARTKPFREAAALIKQRCDALSLPVTIARAGETGKGGLRGMLTAWDDKQRAAAEAERRKLAEEQRRREEEAAAAKRAAEEAAAKGESGINYELAAMRARDEAEAAARRAEAIRAEPTRGHLGQVNRTRRIVFSIEDLNAVLPWVLADTGRAAKLLSAVTNIVDQHLRSLGVETVAKGGIEIPGVTAGVELGAAGVRR